MPFFLAINCSCPCTFFWEVVIIIINLMINSPNLIFFLIFSFFIIITIRIYFYDR